MSRIISQIESKLKEINDDFEGAQELIEANLDSVSGGGQIAGHQLHISTGQCPEDLCGV